MLYADLTKWLAASKYKCLGPRNPNLGLKFNPRGPLHESCDEEYEGPNERRLRRMRISKLWNKCRKHTSSNNSI